MTPTDLLQYSALALLPIGIGLVLLAIGGPLIGLGAFFIVLAPELWVAGALLDDEGGDEQ